MKTVKELVEYYKNLDQVLLYKSCLDEILQAYKNEFVEKDNEIIFGKNSLSACKKLFLNAQDNQLFKEDFFKSCPYNDTEKLSGQFICKNCRSPKEFQNVETKLNSSDLHMYEGVLTNNGLVKVDNLDNCPKCLTMELD